MNTLPKFEETQHISELRAALLEQSQKTEFDPEPYERATAFLESLPPAEFVDERVRLAWEIVLAAGELVRPDISRRALYAAFPAGSKLKDKLLERRWFTGAGLLEAVAGNVQRALKYKVIALELSAQSKDPLGSFAEWGNLAFMAAGAGLYQDAIQYATVAMKGESMSSEYPAELYAAARLNRANAFFRLGRYAEATVEIAGCLATIPQPPSGRMLHRAIMAQLVFCEIALEKGDRSGAQSALYAAKTGAKGARVPLVELQAERLRFRLSAAECGPEESTLNLENLLQLALEMETLRGQSSGDDLLLDILHSLERVWREHGNAAQADKWLRAIGSRMHSNATKMIVALSEDTHLTSTFAIEAKLEEVDHYLYSKSITLVRPSDAMSPSMSYLIGLAASASAAEDPTKEHGVRVARLASLVANDLGLSKTVQRGIEAGCLIHDVGKVGVPSTILLKEVPLAPGESELYNLHPVAGAELVERAVLQDQTIVQNVVRFHHHSYSGDASNSDLRGEALPLEARIASVCDEYDSLVTGRPRRPAISSNDALREMFAQRSGKFDPKIVDVLVEIVRGLQRAHPDLQAYLSEEAESIEYFAMQRTLKRAAEHALTNN